MTGKLSIVSTPIGNLGDMTFRAIETIKACDILLAEDTRTTIKLLAHYQIPHKEIVSFFEGNEERRMNSATAKQQAPLITLLNQGKHLALVSESGTPLISDPGFKLVREAIMSGINVESIPGPSALISALTVSGLPPNAFLYLGFLPKKEAHIKKLLVNSKASSEHLATLKTIIFYESPHRLTKTLGLVFETLGDVELVVCRELTKIHEEVKRGKVSEVLDYYQKQKPRGEIVVLISY